MLRKTSAASSRNPILIAAMALANAFAAASAFFYGVFGLLLMVNLSGADKSGVWFKPGTFLPLWIEWDPMVVMISRSVGSAMFGAFPLGYLFLPRASFVKEAALLNALYLGFFVSGSFSPSAVNGTFRLLLVPVALLTAAGAYVVFTGDGEGLPTTTPLKERVNKSFGLNSETYINAILIL